MDQELSLLAFFYGFFAAIFIFSVVFLFLYRKNQKSLEERNNVLTALRRMDEVMMSAVGLNNVAQLVTDAVVSEMQIDMGVLGLIDEEKGVLKRVAMSNTPTGLKAKQLLPIPYEQVGIPLNFDSNFTIKAIKTNQVQVTNSLFSVLAPAIDEPTCQKIQLESGLKTFIIYPVSVRGQVRGMMIMSFRKELAKITAYEKEETKKLIDTMGIALDNAFLYENLKITTGQLSQANIKLQQLDQLKDDFVSIASHELRTPMTAIRSYSWMALHRSDIPLSDKMKRYLERTLLSTERLIDLVNDMLNISRIESGRIEISPKSFQIEQLVTEVFGEVGVKAHEKKINLTQALYKMPVVFADPNKVHQVLLNLIGNALKFTNEDGHVTVEYFTDGQMLEVSIKDDGVGISRDDQSRLFAKFGRLDNSYVAAATSGGTGLGLYICKSLIQLMKGRIWATSEGPGTGSTFTFSLPIANQQVLQNASQYTHKAEGETKELEPVAI